MVTMMVTIFYFVIVYLLNKVIWFMFTFFFVNSSGFLIIVDHIPGPKNATIRIFNCIFFCCNITRLTCLAQKLASVFINKWFSYVCVIILFPNILIKNISAAFWIVFKTQFWKRKFLQYCIAIF